MAVRVQSQDFDPGVELAQLTAGNTAIGGVCLFVGLVRDMAPVNGETTAISSLTLEHYPGMTEKELARIEAEACERWSLDEVVIIHRYGTLAPGDRIVMVACASAHRDAAFAACNFLMDFLKTRAPFWKVEDTGTAKHWVEAKAADDAAAEKWNTDGND